MRNGLSALDTALELLRRGLWPVALHPMGAEIPTKDGPKIAKGKEPIGKAWGAERLTADPNWPDVPDNPARGWGSSSAQTVEWSTSRWMGRRGRSRS